MAEKTRTQLLVQINAKSTFDKQDLLDLLDSVWFRKDDILADRETGELMVDRDSGDVMIGGR